MANTVQASSPGLDFDAKRATAVLSDGTAVLAIPQTNGTTRSVLIYSSSNRTAWTLKNTITPTNAIPANTIYTLAVGASNNLHLAWKDSAGNIRYMLLTYSAGSWTPGSEELVGAVGSEIYRYIDMDVLTGDCAVVGVIRSTGGVGNFRSWVRRTSDNAWTQLTDFQFQASAPPNYGQVSVARDIGNANQFVYAVKRADSSGDELRIKVINNSTGAQVSDTRIAQGWLPGVTYRDWMIFSKASNDWVIMALYGSGTGYAAAARFNASGFITGFTKSAALTNSIYRGSSGAVLGAMTFGFVGGDGLAPFAGSVILQPKLGLGTRVITCVFDDPNIRWDKLNVWAGTDAAVTAGMRHYGGNNRNTNFRKMDIADWRATSSPVKAWYNQTPGPVASVSPANGSTITTDQPTLVSQLSSGGNPYPQGSLHGKWVVATNAGFTTNVRTIEDPYSMYFDVPGSPTVQTSEVMTLANELFQGNWYIRGSQRDVFGVESTTFVDNAFTNSHPSTDVVVSPSGNTYLDYGGAGTVNFTWKYTSTSPSEVQTAYQVTVELNDGSSTIIYDSGKVVAGTQVPVNTNFTASTNLATTYKDTPLRWRVRSWDSDDVQGNYSEYGLFQLGDAPTVVITSPTNDGDTVNNPAPTITWTFTGANSRTQATYRLIFYNSSGVAVHDSGTQTGVATSYAPPSPVLSNTTTYSVVLIITDSAGLQKTASRTFLVSFTAPAAPTFTLNSSTYSQQGYLQITWTNAAQDTDFNSWRVYRRLTGTATWVLAAEYTDALASYTYTDWFLPSGTTYDYAVVQTALRFGVVVESAYNASTVNATTEDYWLINPSDSSTNLRLYIVTQDSFSEEYEEETLNIIGRGRKKDYGTRFGYSGSLTAQLRDNATDTARVQKMKLQLLKDLRSKVYIRNPFGDIWQVQFSDITFDRDAGVGNREFGTLTIPYQEVAD